MATSNLWSEVLKMLQLQMAKNTFETWLKDTTAQEEEGRLIVSTANNFAQDWLDNRLRHTIELAVESVFGQKIPVEFRVTANGGYQPDLFFTGTYRDAYNAIVRPNEQHYCSKYFHQKWLPLLGPDLWLIIWELRTHCYKDKTGQIIRDTVEATCKQIGDAVGMSEDKVWRLLNPKDPEKKDLLAKFILNKSTRRRYSKAHGGTVNEKTIWKIRLDDPLTPEDELELQNL